MADMSSSPPMLNETSEGATKRKELMTRERHQSRLLPYITMDSEIDKGLGFGLECPTAYYVNLPVCTCHNLEERGVEKMWERKDADLGIKMSLCFLGKYIGWSRPPGYRTMFVRGLVTNVV